MLKPLTNENQFARIYMTIREVLIGNKYKGRLIPMKFIGMTEEQKLTALQTMCDNGELKKGAYVKFSFKSIKKALKAYEKEHGETTIEKYTEGIVRLGIDYRNTNTYRQKCLTATPMASHPSPYDSPVSGYEHLLIKTDKGDGNVSYKLKVFASKTASKMKSKWYLNGEEVTEQDLDGIMCKQSKPSQDDFIVFTIKLDNLISIGE